MMRARAATVAWSDALFGPRFGVVPAYAGSGHAAPQAQRRDERWRPALVAILAAVVLVGVLAPTARLALSAAAPALPRIADAELPASHVPDAAAALARGRVPPDVDRGRMAGRQPGPGLRRRLHARAGAGHRRRGARSASSWHGVGRPDALTAPAGARLSADGARIEYQRGSVTEWYVNDGRGLEQGFTLDAPPAGSGPVVVELAPTGGFTPVLDAAGDLVHFVGDGTTFTYSGLYAFDAAGDAVPATLGVTEGKVTLTADDAGAAYPLTIDPIITTDEARIRWDFPADGDLFGGTVAVWGDSAVIGQPGRNGGLGGFWSYERLGASWTRRDGTQGQSPETGAALALSGTTAGEPDTLAVGQAGGGGKQEARC